MFIPDLMTSSDVLAVFVFTESVTFADDFALSRFKARVAATGSTVIDIQKNGSNIGTITIAPAGTTGTFATSGGATSYVAGDYMSLVAPASPDATLADSAMTFVGTRT